MGIRSVGPIFRLLNQESHWTAADEVKCDQTWTSDVNLEETEHNPRLSKEALLSCVIQRRVSGELLLIYRRRL